MLSRRFFLKNSLWGLGTISQAASITNSLKDSTDNLVCNKLKIKLKTLPLQFEALKIGFLSDSHIGDCSSAELLEKSVQLISKENPDLVILGGDYVNSLDIGLNRYFYHYKNSAHLSSCQKKVPSFEESILQSKIYFELNAKIVSSLNPQFGILAVLGNHDRWNSAENCKNIFRNYGINLLINEAVVLEKNGEIIEVYGADDYSTGIPKIPAFNSNFRIIVSHNPDFVEEIGSSCNFSLGLSGHTHGGQISLPILGPIFSNIQYPQLIQGLNFTTSGLPVFTTKGVGTSGLPIRINCPPEACILTLERG